MVTTIARLFGCPKAAQHSSAQAAPRTCRLFHRLLQAGCVHVNGRQLVPVDTRPGNHEYEQQRLLFEGLVCKKLVRPLRRFGAATVFYKPVRQRPLLPVVVQAPEATPCARL